MAKVKVHFDDEVWSKFKASVLHRHGSLKALSHEVEGSLRSVLVDEDVLPFLKLEARLGVRDRTRPEMKGPSAADRVREMRRKRFERLS